MTKPANIPATSSFVRARFTRPCRDGNTLGPNLQEQLGHAEVTGSLARLQEELEESKAANAKLQMEQACRQQEWQQQILSSQAEHKSQVCKHHVSKIRVPHGWKAPKH